MLLRKNKLSKEKVYSYRLCLEGKGRGISGVNKILEVDVETFWEGVRKISSACFLSGLA